MKKILLPLAVAAAGCAAFHGLTSCSQAKAEPEWQLVWTEDFDSTGLNRQVWGNCDRGTADWNNTQSPDSSLYEFRDGCIVLKGIVNPDTIADSAKYLTGGIWTKGLKSFEPGRFEVRARLHGAKGAWPAIWLMPFDPSQQWPKGGEIDIMERLNHDDFAYQTVHNYWTYNLGHRDEPKNSGTGKINPDDFNVYGVDILEDKIVLLINGDTTHIYPRVDSLVEQGQFPFYQPMYMLIDMQLGGNWVGEVDPSEVPVEMEVDWVKHYTLKK